MKAFPASSLQLRPGLDLVPGRPGLRAVIPRRLSAGGRSSGQPGRDPASGRRARAPQVNWSVQPGQNVNFARWVHEPVPALTFNWIDDASRNSGMTLAPADPALQAHLSLGKNEGLIVTAIDRGCPAAAAGIHQNDVLIRLGEDESKSIALAKPADLEEGLKAAGDRPTSLALLRAGKKMSVKVQPQFKVSLGPVRPEPPAYWIGVSAGPVEPALRTQLQIPQGQGLIITEVHKDSPAVKAGIQPHDIFLNVDGVATVRPGRPDEARAVAGREADDGRAAATGPQARNPGHTPAADDLDPLSGLRAEDGAIRCRPPRRGHLPTGGPNPSGPGPASGEVDLLIARQIETKNKGVPAQGTGASGKSMEQRLDDLSAQIKELRAAIEALSRAQGRK